MFRISSGLYKAALAAVNKLPAEKTLNGEIEIAFEHGGSRYLLVSHSRPVEGIEYGRFKLGQRELRLLLMPNGERT
ncbi:hypothetical protein COU20_01390 [Candidatus Kaiserbacteria bacterium CG10_big_fil_rev_8_21_14_0_10_59_10]|uniref:Uncharacterized protein n=1 Tax=Candidatus Kaiserbacteria bacterium CG10_big_fil_rev_8_21_14_0_10_59_10 TaxID=1974612 RepID=A0A2H0U857_9BACT|nr:MAG: hypothetical protein COU20_01390 [Candidatus Kaiserbacteria bacterium CG10_big_fil_rev_8_21_14_0_10_59_10]